METENNTLLELNIVKQTKIFFYTILFCLCLMTFAIVVVISQIGIFLGFILMLIPLIFLVIAAILMSDCFKDREQKFFENYWLPDTTKATLLYEDIKAWWIEELSEKSRWYEYSGINILHYDSSENKVTLYKIPCKDYIKIAEILKEKNPEAFIR